MDICIVAEGCYPYVVGGVSGWINSMIRSFPNINFIILAVVPDRDMRGKFVYELPENVTAVYETYLSDFDWEGGKKKGKRTRLGKKEYLALRSILLNEDVDWDTVFNMFQKETFSIDDLLMGADFLRIVQECYKYRYPQIVFSDFLWTMRSIFLPLFLILKTPLPKADIYHCVATGYAGVLGSMAKHFYRSALVISEHGIYTREREEELLKANWVAGVYKNIWIDQFHKMSMLAYTRADTVTSLYSHARELQIGLGCPEEKLQVTPNGIDMDRFKDLPGKTAEDEQYINIGAVLRVAPIKDVKTMIRAFAFAKEKLPSLKLWIMGPTDEDEEYAKECFELVDALKVEDVIFTGRINVTEYLGRMDFTLLTSISEGQPLTILEGFAAHKPVVCTDVGCCRELLYGEDDFGTAGILCHIMNTAELAGAMVEMGRSSQLRKEMGENGYKRVEASYQIHQMIDTYKQIYEQIGWSYGKLLPVEELDADYGAIATEGYYEDWEYDADYAAITEDLHQSEVDDLGKSEVEDMDHMEVKDMDKIEVEDMDNIEFEDLDQIDIKDLDETETWSSEEGEQDVDYAAVTAQRH
ncbi:MAG: GT4 family glycosyltransferase PelF [Acetatifactor sp.]|nr:GT4 family glycosyltransferase PelF [Acetatifactor sp.]